jgi:hypothetical protein
LLEVDTIEDVKRQHILYFPSAVKFSRWLFQQPRGAVDPWAVLLAGWREVKPCLAAMQAAKTGDTMGLRPDAQRPELRALTRGVRPEDTNVGIAVRSVVVLVKNQALKRRASSWSRKGDPQTEGLDISFACGPDQLPEALHSVFKTPFPPVNMNPDDSLLGFTEKSINGGFDPPRKPEMPEGPAQGLHHAGRGIGEPLFSSKMQGHRAWERFRTPSPVYTYRPRSGSSMDSETNNFQAFPASPSFNLVQLPDAPQLQLQVGENAFCTPSKRRSFVRAWGSRPSVQREWSYAQGSALYCDRTLAMSSNSSRLI